MLNNKRKCVIHEIILIKCRYTIRRVKIDVHTSVNTNEEILNESETLLSDTSHVRQ